MTVSFSGKHRPVEGWAEVRSLRMRYLDWGGDGAPVLALHGLASSAHWYDLLAPFLCERFRIVAPDQRGHGRTTQAGDGYDWPSLASDAVGCSTFSASSRPSCSGIPGAATSPSARPHTSPSASRPWYW